MAEHGEIVQGVGIDLGAWAIKGAIGALAMFGVKLRRDVTDLQKKEAECRAAKKAAGPMHDERDRQRLAMWEELKECRKENAQTRDLVQRIAGKLGIDV